MNTENTFTRELNNKLLNERNFKKSFVLFFMVLAGIVVDQYIKYQVFLRPNLPFGLVHFENNKFAFSLPLPIWLIYSLYVLVLGVAGYYLIKRFRHAKSTELVGWALLFAGGLSNIAERIILGYVRDYFMVFNGVFNLADFFIIAGVIFVALANAG